MLYRTKPHTLTYIVPRNEGKCPLSYLDDR